ncbi:MAG: MgtC/SapB family protein [Bacteroidales bacterium]|nr:MgtC/SapB family protein [Candidatus Colimorpha onthohippi]
MVIIDEPTALIRMGISIVLGMAIGLEREKHHHPAGIRTFMLICMGATLATLASIYICQTNTELLNGDPGRIAAQVLTGVGFIGAGLIIKNEDRVSGLTSAAAIFLTASIGVSIGVGMIVTGCVVTLVTILILTSSSISKKKQ